MARTGGRDTGDRHVTRTGCRQVTRTGGRQVAGIQVAGR